MGVKWDLQGCCDRNVLIFIGCYIVYACVTLLFWRSPILKPLKLFAVFIHEMSHGSAAWLTCGKIKSVAVYDSEAGLVVYSGGVKAIVIPAGYVGGAFWGACFVTLSASRLGATIAAGIIIFALLISLM